MECNNTFTDLMCKLVMLAENNVFISELFEGGHLTDSRIRIMMKGLEINKREFNSYSEVVNYAFKIKKQYPKFSYKDLIFLNYNGDNYEELYNQICEEEPEEYSNMNEMKIAVSLSKIKYGTDLFFPLEIVKLVLTSKSKVKSNFLEPKDYEFHLMNSAYDLLITHLEENGFFRGESMEEDDKFDKLAKLVYKYKEYDDSYEI